MSRGGEFTRSGARAALRPADAPGKIGPLPGHRRERSLTERPGPAIFLHGGWRCASTYVWSRFRALPSTTCFYEPFSEHLASTRTRRIARDTAHRWDSRHPPLGTPYRSEYLRLLRPLRQGVPGYRERFALARYFPRDDLAAERSYLSKLIEHASERGTHPVLGFSRSLARAALLKQTLGGYHIVIRRDPRQQWLSCRSYRRYGSPNYFELSHMLILALAPPSSPAGALAHSLGLPRPPAWIWGLRRQMRWLDAALHPWNDELSYRAFLGVYRLSHAMATPAADLILDVDRLSRFGHYRDSVSARVLGGTGMAVDFGGCAVPHHPDTGLELDFAAVEADIEYRLCAFGAVGGLFTAG